MFRSFSRTGLFLSVILATLCFQSTFSQPSITTDVANALRDDDLAPDQETKLVGNITLKLENISLAEILNNVEKQSIYRFIYTNTEIPAGRIFSVNASEKPLDRFLDDLLDPLQINYKTHGKQIVLSRRKDTGKKVGSVSDDAQTDSYASLKDGAVITTGGDARAAVTVTGTVLDENKMPLPGVSIVEQGTSNGAVTDVRGAFTLELNSAEATLIFSFIGYVSQQVPLGGKTVVNITLAPEIATLDEVVIVGYGEQKRSDLTGAITTVKPEDIKNLPTKSVADALQGRVAGVYVTAESGRPGSTPNITLRGPANINGVAPLYVIDGMPFFGTGFNFNTQDIESMEVIKDASAAAIYGAQAGGGVILITTKKGKSGKIKIGANTSYGIRNVIKLPELLRKTDFIKAKVANGADQASFGDISKLPDTDWYGALFQPAVEQNYTLYLSGGGDKSNFYASGNYQSSKGVLIDNKLERFTLRLNSQHKLSDKITFGQTLYGTYTYENPPNAVTPLSFRTSPLKSIYDPTNPLGGWGRDYDYPRGNPVGDQYTHYTRNGEYNINSAVNLTWNILKGLQFKTNAGINAVFDNSYSFNNAYDFGVVYSKLETFSRSADTRRDLQINYTLTYDKTVGDHYFKILAGYEARKQNKTHIDGTANFPLVPNAQTTGLSSVSTNNTLNFNGYDVSRILSQFARLDYSFRGKYLAQVNFARNGVSDIFGPANRFGTYPSMSLGWKINEENFMTNIQDVTNLKLRMSWGQLGNYQGISQFLYNSYYGDGFVYDFAGGAGLVKGYSLNGLSNNKIGWEVVTTTNAGLDIGLFKNKLNITLDAYTRQTRKMVYKLPVSPSAGFGNTAAGATPYSVFTNIGEMSNQGFEFLIDYKSKYRDFSFGISANGSFNRNKLISLSSATGDQQIIDGTTPPVYGGQQPSRSVPGKPLGQFWGLKADGIYQADDPSGPKLNNATPKAGDLIYRDINNDGIINGDDRTFIGNPWPKLTYGITLNGGWKGFDVRFFFTGVQGVDIYNVTQSYEYFFYSGDYNTTEKIFSASYFNGNKVTNVPRSSSRNWSQLSSYHVQNGSFLRLKNLQVGYSVPSAILSKVNILSARIFVMADNLLTVTRYKGIDPESALSGHTDVGQGQPRSKGIDDSLSRYPLSRMFSVGLNLEF